MARSPSDILKEYLVSIGFQVDESQAKKAKSSLQDIGKKFEGMALKASAAATALAASVTEIASRLEKLYFASQRTGASVTQIQNLRYAAEQVGVSADDAQAALEGMTRAMRLNPGLVAMLKNLNINPNQDKVKVLMDLIDRLRRMPFYQGSRIAEMFGINSDTLLMLEKNFDQLKKYEEERQRMANQAGVTSDQMAQKSHEFMVKLRALEQRLEILWDLIAVRLIPAGEKLIDWLSKTIDFFIRADKATDGWSTRLLGLASAVGGLAVALKALSTVGGILGIGGGGAGAAAGGGALGTIGLAAAGIIGTVVGGHYLNEARKNYNLQGEGRERMHLRRLTLLEQQGRLSDADRPMLEQLRKVYPQGPDGPKVGAGPLTGASSLGYVLKLNQTKTAEDVHQLIKDYSSKFGVNPGLSEAVAHAESHFNQKAISPKGAIGTFQLMPETAKALGVNPNELSGNVEGGIRYLSELLKKYNGDEVLALAAYNAGSDKVKKYGGVPPFKETRNYIDEILQYRLAHGAVGNAPVTVSQKTDIHVNGSSDPKQVASDVFNGQDRVNGDLVRNFAGAVR